MRRAGIPAECQSFRERWKIALALLDELALEVEVAAVVCEAGYDEIREFLGELDARGHIFVAQVPEHHSFWSAGIAVIEEANRRGRPRRFPRVAEAQAQPLRAKQWHEGIEREGRKWQKVKLALQQPKTVEVVAVRVREAVAQAWWRPGPQRWLLSERENDGRVQY